MGPAWGLEPGTGSDGQTPWFSRYGKHKAHGLWVLATPLYHHLLREEEMSCMDNFNQNGLV